MNFQFISTILSRFVTVTFTQEDKGVKKYGKTLDPKDSYDWLEMAEEEIVDAWKYLQCAKHARETDKAALKAAGERIRELEDQLRLYQRTLELEEPA